MRLYVWCVITILFFVAVYCHSPNDDADHSSMRNENPPQSTETTNQEQQAYMYDAAFNASCKHKKDNQNQENKTTTRFSIKKKNKPKQSIDPYLYFTDSDSSDEQNAPRLPEFWKYHSFLQEPLQSKMGGESLTRHLMDQCMDTFFKMERNIERACGEHENNGYTNIEKTVDIDASKHSQVLESYKKQRCQQLNYVAAISATTMCLTENSIRQKFIEHYADIASDNPVEGPQLYLKKIHEAMEKMSMCSQNEPDNTFPNLWRGFSRNPTYDPNAPFFVDDKKDVRLDIMHCNGKDNFMTDDALRCTDTHLLDNKSVYKSVPGNQAYSRTKDYTCSQSVAYRYLVNNASSYPTIMDRKCNKIGSSMNDPDLTDKSLSSLYNSVHQGAFGFSAMDRMSDQDKKGHRRPFTIAEAFIKSNGPLLDGFGIMYYCGHHACRANHKENPDGACFPKFKWEKDWSKVLHKLDKDFLASADILERCINDGLLSSREILSDQRVYYANATIHRRSDLCISEEEIVKFVTKIYPLWVTESDALSLVFGRHLAESVCYEERNRMCKTTEDAYDAMKVAVKGLIEKCRNKPRFQGTKRGNNSSS